MDENENCGSVCQLPGCSTTQKDLEEAFSEYITEYCVKCEKKRDGSLCRCPFPCSLSFKGVMLEKIFELIHTKVPTELKSIQVCYKHPDLLRQARDISIQSKECHQTKSSSKQAASSSPIQLNNEPHSLHVQHAVKTSQLQQRLLFQQPTRTTSVSQDNVFTSFSPVKEFRLCKPGTSSINDNPDPEPFLAQTHRDYDSLKTIHISNESSVVGLTSSILHDKSQIVLPEELFKIPVNEMLESSCRDSNLSSGYPLHNQHPDHHHEHQGHHHADNHADHHGDHHGDHHAGHHAEQNVDRHADHTGEPHFVYNSDDHNDIIIQGVGEDGGISKSSRVMKIHLADMNASGAADMNESGTSMTIPGSDMTVPGFLLSDIVPHTRGISAASESEINYDLSDPMIIDRSVEVKKVVDVDGTRKRGFPSDILEPATNSINIQQIKRRKNPKPSKALRNHTIKKIESLPSDVEHKYDDHKHSDGVNVGNSDENLHAASQESKQYDFRILNKFAKKMVPRELPSLLNISKLCDLVFYCCDGQVSSSSMMLASVSPFLKELMTSHNRIDPNRAIILPDEFSTSQLNILNKILYQELNLEEMDLEDLYNIQPLAILLNIQSIIQLYEARVYSTQSIIQFHLDPVVNSDHEGHTIGHNDHEGHSIIHGEQEDEAMVDIDDDESDPTVKNDVVNAIHAVGKRPVEEALLLVDKDASTDEPLANTSTMVLLDQNTGQLKFTTGARTSSIHETTAEQAHIVDTGDCVEQDDISGSLEEPVLLEGTTQINIQDYTSLKPNLNTPVRVHKNDLNTDYLDEDGVVRLDTRLEMPIHYCIVCDAKFKKYKQAMTHYAEMHMLAARLACDICDQLFDDMYTCNKHKHAVHGGFDCNLECYICKTVSYSRHRLKTHIKDSHFDVYGDFQCKKCAMKFAAKYYLTQHIQTNHNQETDGNGGNSCGICRKHFSGKRYLTMHMKSVHQTGGRHDYECKICGEPFHTKKQLAFHRVRMHNDPDKSCLEICHHCNKYFKTRTELKNHLQKKHK